MATDDELILQMFFQRDEQALHSTTEKYGTLCRSLACNLLCSSEDAEECLNDALLAAWNAIPPAHPQYFRAYLLRLVRNFAINRRNADNTQKRGGSQLPQALDELTECIASPESVEHEIDKREIAKAITAFLGTLPRQQRDLFVRRYWYASSVAECAALFGMSENNVKVTLSRIRGKLRKYLEKEGWL